jgi:Zn-dependent protease
MGVLRFKLFGFPVQVHPMFWLVSFLLFSGAGVGFTTHLVYAGVILLSILTHELGHAVAARSAGQEAEISIHAFGGLTRWVPNRPLSRWRLIGITLAGPAAGLALAAAGFFALRYLPTLGASKASAATLRNILGILFQVNLVWSLVNLLPVLPFDGGQVMAHALGPSRRQLSATLSAIFGVLIAIVFWYRFKWPFAAIMFGLSGLMEYRAMDRARRAALAITPDQIERALKEARSALDSGDAGRAMQLVQMVAALPAAAEQQRRAMELGAWAALAIGNHAEARHALRALSPGPVDALLQAAVLETHGDTERAVACLRHARESGDLRPQVSASLVRVLLKDGRYGEAATVTQQILDDVPTEDARRVAQEAMQGGRSQPSAELSLALFARTHDPSDAVAAARGFLSANDHERAAHAVGQAVAAGQAVSELDEVLVRLVEAVQPNPEPLPNAPLPSK